MDLYFWNAYKRLEHETLTLADSIHVCDDQLKVYSERIGDLLVRASIEAESLVKVLYHANGGTKPGGKDLYFDTDCFGLLESKWVISKKTIYVTASSFYLQNENNRVLRPLYKSYKRGTSSSDWQKAYQAVKHDRVHNLKSGNLRNLLLAMGALYIINIYYRGAHYTNLSDLKGSNIDWGLGSELFSVKISPESEDKSIRKAYQKKPDYDECIYIIKHTDETNRALKDILVTIDKETNEKSLVLLLEKAGIEKLDQFDTLESEKKQILVDSVQETKNKVYRETLLQHSSEMRKAVNEMVIEAVLNKNQY